MQSMWAFVTIIISQITFHSSGIFLPLPFSAPVIRLSHFVFLQISQMADDTVAELDRHLAVKTKELLGWKSPRGQPCSQAQFLVGPMGGKLAPLYPIHTEGCPHALVSPWKASLPVGHCWFPSSCPLSTPSALDLLAWVALRESLLLTEGLSSGHLPWLWHHRAVRTIGRLGTACASPW